MEKNSSVKFYQSKKPLKNAESTPPPKPFYRKSLSYCILFNLREALLIPALLFLFTLPCKAQFKDTIIYSMQQKPQVFVTLASFNTFIDHDFASIDGLRAGLDYNNRIRYGLGYFALANNSVVSDIVITDTSGTYTTNGQLRLHFFTLSTEYFFKNKFPWMFSVLPFNVGFGSAKYEYVPSGLHQRVSTPKEFVILYQPALSFQYSFLSWFGAGLTGGYRYTLYRSKKQSQHLNAPAFSFDIRVSLDILFKEIKEHGIFGVTEED
jgi:hypothetical protein